MTANRKPKTENYLLEADQLLTVLAEAQTAVKAAEAEAELELARIREAWQKILAPLRARVAQLDKDIIQTAKQHRLALFAEVDRVDLAHGALLHSWQESVKRARGVLAALKDQGLEDAIKVVETVKWEVLEAWPEEKLISVGTERTRRELFAYEVKESCRSTPRPT